MNFKKKIKQFIKRRKISLQYKTSFNLYMFSILILLITIIGTSQGIQIIIKLEDYLSVLILFLFIIGFFIDIIFIVKSLWGTKTGKLIHFIAGFLAFTISYSFAKQIVHFHTELNPDIFNVSVHFFTGIGTVLTWILIINIFIGFVIFSSLVVWGLLQFISVVLYELHRITIGMFTNRTLKLNLGNLVLYLYIFLLNKPLKKKRIDILIVHVFLFIMAYVPFAMFLDFKILQPIINLSNHNFNKQIIAYLSYYPEKNAVCTGLDGQRIKLLDLNQVSIVRYGKNNEIYFKKDFCKNKI